MASISPRDWKASPSPAAICLSEDAYRQVKSRLDLAVSDLGPTRTQEHRRADAGLFAASRPTSASEAGRAIAASRAPSSAPRLSIVVLPFANLSGDPEQEYFVDGVTESLTTDLSAYCRQLRDRPQHRLHLQGQGL